METVSDENELIQSVDLADAWNAWKKVPPITITNCFRKAGFEAQAKEEN